MKGAGGQFDKVVEGMHTLVRQPQEGWDSPLTVLINAGLSANNVAAIMHGARGTFDKLLQNLLQFVTAQPPAHESTFERILRLGEGVGLNATRLAHILDGAGGTFNKLVEDIEAFVTPPGAEPDALSAFEELIVGGAHLGIDAERIARAFAGAGNRFNALLERLHAPIFDGDLNWDRRIRHDMYAYKLTGQTDVKPRENFLFDDDRTRVSIDIPRHIGTVILVMENDERSKEAARRLCAKRPGDTLCVEWNPEANQWRAVTRPDGRMFDPHQLHVDPQAKLVMVGHYRQDGTMAALSPEQLAAAQIQLMQELGVTAPRRISLTGVCYTAPQLHALDAAAGSLAGRFVAALHKAGLAVPVTSIDGEVTVNDQGRKQIVLPNDRRAPAILHKVILEVDQDGKVVAHAPVLNQRMAVAETPAPNERPGVMPLLGLKELQRLQRLSTSKSMQAKLKSSVEHEPAASNVVTPAAANPIAEPPLIASIPFQCSLWRR